MRSFWDTKLLGGQKLLQYKYCGHSNGGNHTTPLISYSPLLSRSTFVSTRTTESIPEEPNPSHHITSRYCTRRTCRLYDIQSEPSASGRKRQTIPTFFARIGSSPNHSFPAIKTKAIEILLLICIRSGSFASGH